VSLARGKFGVEYNPRRMQPENSGFGWIVVAVALVALVSFGWSVVRRVTAPVETPVPVAEPSLAAPVTSPQVPAAETSRTFQTFQPLNADLTRRPPKLRNLLMRLEEADRRRDVEMAVTTIETIRALPGSPAADIDDSLARRLGALNLRRLFDLRNAQWVAGVVVKRGDSASRIAAENGSTLASFERLNGGKIDRVVLGRTMYVMNHPRFNLVIHRRSRTADLALNGKFFKRYDLTDEVKAREGAYAVPEKRRSFWGGVLGRLFSSADRLEIDMLLPTGTPVLVSEM